MAATKKREKMSAAELVASLRTSMAPVEGLSTGNVELDFITGVGGYPKGRITEQFGQYSSGKTSSAMQAAALVLQECERTDSGYVMYLDYEFAMDPKYAKSLGLDVDSERFVYLRPTSFESGAADFRALLATGELRMAIFDSVAAMVTEREQDSATGQAEVMQRAKLLHQFCRQIKGPLEQHGCAAIFINHTMVKADLSPMGQRMAAQGIKTETQPGGTALPFYASLRISFKRVGKVRDDVEDELTLEKTKAVRQEKILAQVVKNKVGDPFREAELRIRFGKGFSQEHSVLQVLVRHRIVKKGGAGVYSFPEHLRRVEGESKIQKEDRVVSMMEADPEWTARLLEAAQEVLNSGTYEGANAGSVVEVDDGSSPLDYDPETGEVLDDDERE